MSDMAVLNVQSAELRSARAKVRRDLQTGAKTLADVLVDPPACLHAMAVLDVMRMVHIGGSRSWQHRTGASAVYDGVNLLVTVGQASLRTREWAVAHTPMPGPTRLRVRAEAAA